MSIQTAIQDLRSKVSAAWAAVEEKGGTMPSQQNLENLASGIAGIPNGDGQGSSSKTYSIVEDCRHAFFYWKKNIKSEDVQEQLLDYSNIAEGEFSEFASWYMQLATGVQYIPENQVDNFSLWYSNVSQDPLNEAVGNVFTEFTQYLRESGIQADLSLPAGTNFFINSGDHLTFAQWYNSSFHFAKIPQDIFDEFTDWYNQYYEDDELIGDVQAEDLTQYASTSLSNAFEEGKWYTGTATHVNFIDQDNGDHSMGIKNLSASVSNNVIIFNSEGSGDVANNMLTLSVMGDNYISSTNRCVSVTGSGAYCRMVGCKGPFDSKTPSLCIRSSATKVPFKGNWFFENVDFQMTANAYATASETEHLVLVGGASYTVNSVNQVALEDNGHGTAYVDIGNGIPGSATIATRSQPDDGYVLSGYYVNNTFYEGEITTAHNIVFAENALTKLTPVFVASGSARTYSFAAASDIHLRTSNYYGGLDDFRRFLTMSKGSGADMVCIAGDLGYEAAADERALFKGIKEECLGNPAEPPVYICVGNHDAYTTDANWLSATGCQKDFAVEKDGDVFLFMSLSGGDGQSGMAPAQTNTPYRDSTLEWLETQLEDNKDKRVFVFSHFPLYNSEVKYPGMGNYTTYGFTSETPQNNRIIDALKSHGNVFYFSGHTHHALSVQSSCPNNNVYSFPDSPGTVLVHIPSLCYPRNASGSNLDANTEAAHLSASCEGYIVDVYPDRTVINGYDFSYRSIYQTCGTLKHEYVYEYPNSAIPGIVMSKADAGMQYLGGDVFSIQVSLASGPGTVTLESEYAVLSRNSLTFTSSNYREPQTVYVTVPAGTAAGKYSITATSNGVPSRSLYFYVGEAYSLSVDLANVTTSANYTQNTYFYNDMVSQSVNGTIRLSAADTAVKYAFNDATVYAKSGNALYIDLSSTSCEIDLTGNNAFIASASRPMTSRAQTPVSVTGHDGATLLLSTNSELTSGPLKGEFLFKDLSVGLFQPANTGFVQTNDGQQGVALVGDSTLVFLNKNVQNVKYVTQIPDDIPLTVQLGTLSAGAIDQLHLVTSDGYAIMCDINNGQAYSQNLDGMASPGHNECLTLSAQLNGTTINVYVAVSQNESLYANTIDLAYHTTSAEITANTLFYGTMPEPINTAWRVTNTDIDELSIGFDNAYFKSSTNTAVMIESQNVSCVIDLSGDNIIHSDDGRPFSKRGNGVEFIGHNGASLALITNGSTQANAIKGEMLFRDLSTTISQVNNPYFVELNLGQQGVSLAGESTLVFSNSGVQNAQYTLHAAGLDSEFALLIGDLNPATGALSAVVPAGYSIGTVTYNGTQVGSLSSIGLPASNEQLEVTATRTGSSINFVVQKTELEETDFPNFSSLANVAQMTGSNQLSTNTLYFGTGTSAYLETTSLGPYSIGFSDMQLSNASSIFYLNNTGNVSADIHLSGNNRLVNTSGQSTFSNGRTMTTGSAIPINMIGHNDATLYLQSRRQNPIKGSYNFYDLDVVLSAPDAVNIYDDEPVNRRIALYGDSSFKWTKVEQTGPNSYLPSGITLSVSTTTNDASVPVGINFKGVEDNEAIDVIVPAGYSLRNVTVNGEAAALSTVTVPISNGGYLDVEITIVGTSIDLTIQKAGTDIVRTFDPYDVTTYVADSSAYHLSGSTTLLEPKNEYVLSGVFANAALSCCPMAGTTGFDTALYNLSATMAASSGKISAANADSDLDFYVFGDNMLSVQSQWRVMTLYTVDKTSGEAYLAFHGCDGATLSAIGGLQDTYDTLKGSYLVDDLDFTYINKRSSWTNENTFFLSATGNSVVRLAQSESGPYSVLSIANNADDLLSVSLSTVVPGTTTIKTSGIAANGLSVRIGSKTYTNDLTATTGGQVVKLPAYGSTLTLSVL